MIIIKFSKIRKQKKKQSGFAKGAAGSSFAARKLPTWPGKSRKRRKPTADGGKWDIKGKRRSWPVANVKPLNWRDLGREVKTKETNKIIHSGNGVDFFVPRNLGKITKDSEKTTEK